MKTLVARRIVLLPGHSATPNKLKAQLSTTASIIGDPRVSCRYTDHYNRSKAFSDAHLKPEAKIWDESAVFPHSNYSKFAELGYGGIYAGKDVGGSQLSRSEGVVIYEALATGCVTLTAMLSIHNACVTTIDRFGSLEQRLEWLPELCTLETKASFCLTEPGSGSDAASLQTSAVLRDDHYHINGSKCFISGAGMFCISEALFSIILLFYRYV